MNKVRRKDRPRVLLAFLGMMASCALFEPVSAAVPAANGQISAQTATKNASAPKTTKKKSASKSAGKPAAPVPDAGTAGAPQEGIYAMVNGESVLVKDFRGLLAETMRSRYYHGTIPEGLAEAVYKEVGDMVIERELLAQEAVRRGIKPDPSNFEETMAKLDARFATQPQWQQQRAQFLPQLKLNADRESLVKQLEHAVREVPQPSPTEVRAYYDQKPELFTEPQQEELSIILLRVDPGASKEGWDQAREEALKIRDRIIKGADFSEQARLHSQHDSAANGGKMDYLHGGMLPKGIEDKISSFQVGVLNEPMDTLEGIALARLENRIEPKLREFSSVEKRAQDLLIRDRAEEAWQKTIRSLRANADIKILAIQAPGGK